MRSPGRSVRASWSTPAICSRTWCSRRCDGPRSEIHYFKGANGREVDFVARMPDGSRVLVQVCESLVDPRTRKREVKALDRAMAESGTARGDDRDPRRGRDHSCRQPATSRSCPRGGFCSTSVDARSRSSAGDRLSLSVDPLELRHERSERVDAPLRERVVDRRTQAHRPSGAPSSRPDPQPPPRARTASPAPAWAAGT